MKRMIAVLAALCVLCVAVCGTLAEEPTIPEEPPVTEEPTIPEEPPVSEEPTVPEEPAATDEPMIPEEPAATDEPAVPEEPAATDEPTAPEEPAATDEPTAPEEPAATDEPTATEDPAATDEPTATEEPAATDEPTVPEEPAATGEPTASGEPTPTPSPTPVPEEEPELPADIGDPSSPAYIQHDGYREYGSVQSLLGGGVIVLQTLEVNEVSSGTTDLGAMFGIDSAALPEGADASDYHVNVSKYDPSGNTKSGVVFVWASTKPAPTPAEALGEQLTLTPDEDVPDEYELQVTPTEYVSGAPCRPTFSLASYPELSGGAGYAVVKEGEEPVPCGDVYAPAASGTYRFAVLDAEGKLLAQSAKFEVLVEAKTESEDLTLLTAVDPEPSAVYAPTLAVVPGEENVYGAWTNVPAKFALVADIDANDTEAYAYGITYDGGGTWTMLNKDVFIAPEGAYTLSFGLLSFPGGTLVPGTQSASYELKLDFTPPLLTAVGQGLTLSVTAADTGCKVVSAISVDGGASWNVPARLGGEEGIYQCAYSAAAPCAFAAGVIRARDAAGNVALSTGTVELTQPQQTSAPSGGTGGTGGSGGHSGGTTTVTRISSHASSDVDDITAYNGVALSVESGAMQVLTIGQQTLDLTIQASEGEPAFTAGFARWDGMADGDPDTLVLTAEEGDAAEGGCEWVFSGAVYKKLAASGVDYMVFRVGERAAALSTAGFAAGVRYSLLRAAGLASKDFVYTLTMDASGALALRVSVEGQTYELSGDSADEFYYYDVYAGSADGLGAAAGWTERGDAL